MRAIVLAIVGPTGTGKTELACAVARRSGAEVIGVDSMQVYRGMDIGTAKPDRALRDEIPHHMIDVVDPDDEMTAGRYAEQARRAARGILDRGRRVVLCGGTGLYARVFAGGLIAGGAPDAEMRAGLRARSLDDLRAELARLDPDVCREIEPNDRVRIERALEGFLLTGKPTSALRREHRFSDRPFEVRWLGLGLDRAELVRRLDLRVEQMFAEGLVDEVRALRARYPGRPRPLRAIGYREVGELLDGALTPDEARERMTVATRRYAKRQMTWFRSEPGVEWVDVAHPERALERALARLE